MNWRTMVALLATGLGLTPLACAKDSGSVDLLVPATYVVVDRIQGDLNGDKRPDYVLLIKGTDKSKVVNHEYRGELDLNRRGIIVAFGTPEGYSPVIENRACFYSEDEDGGVYFVPEIDVSIQKGTLRIHFSHGRYGYWEYNFRYQHSDFELIGYDSSDDQGPVVERTTSINLLTRKMRVRENTVPEAEPGEEEYKESWTSFELPTPVRLRDISDFDEFNVLAAIGLPQ